MSKHLIEEIPKNFKGFKRRFRELSSVQLSGVREMSRIHEGSPRIVKRLRAESEKCQSV